MESERARRIRSFVIGGIVGSAAGLVAAGRMRVPRRPEKRQTPAGLAAFEQAPCYAETLEREAREETPVTGSRASRARPARSAG